MSPNRVPHVENATASMIGLGFRVRDGFDDRDQLSGTIFRRARFA
jgi:hypothetical protein